MAGKHKGPEVVPANRHFHPASKMVRCYAEAREPNAPDNPFTGGADTVLEAIWDGADGVKTLTVVQWETAVVGTV